jgi:hypothetical protein
MVWAGVPVNTSANSRVTACHMRDFLCKRNGTFDYSATGIGWTLVDSSYAIDEDNFSINDWFVISSTGENGNERLFFKIQLAATAGLRVFGYLNWDPVTHTGTAEYGGTAEWCYMGSTAHYFFMGGDLDSFYLGWTLVTNGWQAAGSSYAGWFGKYISPIDQGPVAPSNGPFTAGTDRTLTIPDATLRTFKLNNYLVIYDETKVERIRVKTNNGVNQITADLANNYAATAKLRSCLPYMMNNSPYTLLGTSVNGTKEIIDVFGVLNSGTNKNGYSLVSRNYADGGLQNEYSAIPFLMYGAATAAGTVYIIPYIYRGDAWLTIKAGSLVYGPGGKTYFCLFNSYNTLLRYQV